MSRISFSQLRSELAARTILETRLPKGTLRPVVEKLMKEAQARCYNEEGWLVCEHKEETQAALVTWEVAFLFDQGNHLQVFNLRRTVKRLQS